MHLEAPVTTTMGLADMNRWWLRIDIRIRKEVVVKEDWSVNGKAQVCERRKVGRRAGNKSAAGLRLCSGVSLALP